MNESPVRTVKDVLLENEALSEDNDTLFETNEALIKTIRELREENETLKEKVSIQRRMIDGLKLCSSKSSLEHNEMADEIRRLSQELQTIKSMGVWEFANKYCTDEENSEAGKQLAKSLLGGA